jgi:hypothetical protein
MNRKILGNTAILYLYAILGLILCAEVSLNLTPPITRDALVHHLTVPKLWIQHGGFYEIPWADFSYYPMYINLLYIFCLYFKNDIAPKFIHLAFGLGTGWLIFFYLKQKIDCNWGLLGMVIFITTPVVIWLCTSAYIDLGMTFFTTGSVLAFVKWRDSEYNKFVWFLISSISMGIAVGSKYNALIAWFIMNMMLMFGFVRDTRQQTKALGYGILFFLIAAVVASPWYLKNYFQTGNPFYPLFNKFFQTLHHQPVQSIIHNQFVEKTSQLSFFKMREIMYGETFWETLLIPIRMFFQGKDNSYRYFQGSLNPILIVFSPFMLLNKRYIKDKFLFVIFSVLFIIMAYFLTAKQVRYILPVLPFLSIIAVMGIKDLMDGLGDGTLTSFLRFSMNDGSISRMVIFSTVAILLLSNLFYLKNRMDIIKPFPYLFGKETKDAFLKRHLSHYDAVKYVNATLPEDAVIFTMFLGRRGYYLERNYKNEPSFGANTLNKMVISSKHDEEFKEYIKSMGVTHILIRTDLVGKYLRDNFSPEKIKRFLTIENKYWRNIYENNGYSVWNVNTGS